ncbi:unnamed protein product [Amoebophrya sp. A120]|nr:unnamed protein product [Amoebophrya sp. A120]|eukprot:GSA120T00002940001.1
MLCCLWAARPNGKRNMSTGHIWMGVGALLLALRVAYWIVLLVRGGVARDDVVGGENNPVMVDPSAIPGGPEPELTLLWIHKGGFITVASIEFVAMVFMCYLTTVFFSRQKLLLMVTIAFILSAETLAVCLYLCCANDVGGEIPLLRVWLLAAVAIGGCSFPIILALNEAFKEELDENGDRVFSPAELERLAREEAEGPQSCATTCGWCCDYYGAGVSAKDARRMRKEMGANSVGFQQWKQQQEEEEAAMEAAFYGDQQQAQANMYNMGKNAGKNFDNYPYGKGNVNMNMPMPQNALYKGTPSSGGKPKGFSKQQQPSVGVPVIVPTYGALDASQPPSPQSSKQSAQASERRSSKKKKASTTVIVMEQEEMAGSQLGNAYYSNPSQTAGALNSRTTKQPGAASVGTVGASQRPSKKSSVAPPMATSGTHLPSERTAAMVQSVPPASVRTTGTVPPVSVRTTGTVPPASVRTTGTVPPAASVRTAANTLLSNPPASVRAAGTAVRPGSSVASPPYTVAATAAGTLPAAAHSYDMLDVGPLDSPPASVNYTPQKFPAPAGKPPGRVQGAFSQLAGLPPSVEASQTDVVATKVRINSKRDSSQVVPARPTGGRPTGTVQPIMKDPSRYERTPTTQMQRNDAQLYDLLAGSPEFDRYTGGTQVIRDPSARNAGPSAMRVTGGKPEIPLQTNVLYDPSLRKGDGSQR